MTSAEGSDRLVPTHPPRRQAPLDGSLDARRAVMRICASATRQELDQIVGGLADAGEAEDLRPAETGLVMLRGRIGGEGAPFNLGEATLTRAAVRLPGGRQGFAYHLGRDRAKARLAAVVDALWQEAPTRAAVEAGVAVVAERQEAERRQEAARVAATRVNFFTMARGED